MVCTLPEGGRASAEAALSLIILRMLESTDACAEEGNIPPTTRRREMSTIASAICLLLPDHARETPARVDAVFFLKISRFLRMQWQTGLKFGLKPHFFGVWAVTLVTGYASVRFTLPTTPFRVNSFFPLGGG
jgi:hypothetical protein